MFTKRVLTRHKVLSVLVMKFEPQWAPSAEVNAQNQAEGEREDGGGGGRRGRMRRWSTLVVQIMKDCGVNWY